MLGNWNIKASDPGENLTISISVQHPELGNYFTATLKAKRFCPSSESDHAFFFWLMPHKVAVWIYWHVSFISALPSSYCLMFSIDFFIFPICSSSSILFSPGYKTVVEECAIYPTP